jgi:hypothetical protein
MAWVLAGIVLLLALGGARPAAAAEIHGVKWNDANGNGVKDAGEPGLPDWKIFLDSNENGLWDSGETYQMTDADGNYAFAGLSEGTYLVGEVAQSGWDQTFPGAAPAMATMKKKTVPPVTTTGSNAPAYLYGDDAGVEPQTVQSAPLINMPAFRADPRFAGATGAGFAAAILDTGVDLNHPFFGPDADTDGVADRIVYHYDFADNDADASDVEGHGSNVTSIVASQSVTYGGMAPGADIISLKVFKSSNGSGSFGDIEEALQWVVANAAAYNIASVNMSLGDSGNYSSPLSLYGIGDEMAALEAMDVMVVSAAGNAFYPKGSVPGVSYPAADANSLAISASWDGNNGGPFSWSSGAVDYTTGADRVVSFSQRHQTMTDVFAPGALITGANAIGGTVTMAGTSQASPHIAGIAVLAQELAVQRLGRRLTLAEFRGLLSSTGVSIVDGDDEDDNVTNTGLTFKRVDMLALGNAIWNMATGFPGMHTVTLSAGQVLTGINFGNTQSATLEVQSTPVIGVAVGSSTGHGGTTDYAKLVTPDASVNLQAPTGDPTGYDFVKWMIGGSDQPAGQKSVSFTMPGTGATAVAVYAAQEWTLRVLASDGNGSVAPGVGDQVYTVLDSASMTATPDAGSYLDHWEVNGTGAGAADPLAVGPGTNGEVIEVKAVFADYTADLADTELILSPAPDGWGQEFEIHFTVENLDAGNAGAFRVGLYLSENSAFDPGVDVLLDSMSYTGLAGGGTINESLWLWLPASSPFARASGTFYVVKMVDDQSAVAEADESNNADSAPFDIPEPPGSGLQGEYFHDMAFSQPALTRIDPTVNFTWPRGTSPDPSMDSETFSVRWTGQVKALYSQTYTFYTVSDDGVRLWVNGVQLVNNWTNHSAAENSGTIALAAGQRYDIVMEYFDNTLDATAKLLWSSASQAKLVIPQVCLYPPTPIPDIHVTGGGLDILNGDMTPRVEDGTDFGPVLLGAGGVAHTFTVRNVGGGTLNFTDPPNPKLTGPNAADFLVTVGVSSPVSPGESVNFTIRFDPGGVGLRQATVTIDSDDPDEPFYDFAVQGTGQAPGPEIDVRGNGLSIAAGDTTPRPEDGTDFGSVQSGGSVEHTFTIANTGDASLNFTNPPNPKVTGPFAPDFVVTSGVTPPVAPGGTVTFTLRFTPSGLGLRQATVTIDSDDANEGAYTFTVQGDGSDDGTGLQGEYFDDIALSEPVLTRIDPTVNFTWPRGTSPDPGMDGETFSVRWTGQVKTLYTQTYTFYTVSDDGVRLWVNGVQLVNNWTNHGATENSGTIALNGSQRYDIVMEYYDNTLDATAKLLWSSASQAKQIIPQVCLYPPTPACEFVIEADPLKVLEGGTGTVRVKLSSEPADDVVADVGWLGGSDADLSVTSGDPLTIAKADWDVWHEIVISAAEDADHVSGVGTLQLHQTAGSTAVPDAQVTLIEQENDIVFVLEADPVTVPEGGTGTVRVKLSAEPVDDVGVDEAWLIGYDADLGIVSGNPLTISKAAWDQWHAIVVSAAEDADTVNGTGTLEIHRTSGSSLIPNAAVELVEADNDVSYTLTVNSGSGDGNYVPGTIVSITADGAPASMEFDRWIGDVAGVTNVNAASTTVTMPTANTTLTATYRDAAGTGLQGDYFDDMALSQPALTRIDPTVNFTWPRGTSPDASMDGETFSVRWTGQVKTLYTQTYTFYTVSDDGVRLWVNGVQLVNNWTNHGATENSGTIALTAGQRYDIVMEYYDNTLDATVKLSWSSASQAKEIIPQVCLYPPAPECVFVLEADSVKVLEGGTGTVRVKLSSEPADDVAADVAWLGGSDADLSVTSGDPLTIAKADWDVWHEIVISAAEDADHVSGTGTLELHQTLGSTAVPDAQVTLIERENDILFVLEADPVSAPEGGTGTVRVKLSAEPVDDVGVDEAWLPGADADLAVISGNPLTILKAAWDQWHAIVVSASEDADTVNGTATLEIRQTSGSSTIPNATVQVIEADNDVSYTLTVNSGTGDGTYTPGTIVPITADAALPNMEFDRWTGDVAGVANVNAASTTVTMSAATVTLTATYRDAAGTGLQGDYFDDMALSQPALKRIDPTVNFTWPRGTSPDPSMDSETFSVRWTGQVKALYAQTYTFYTVSDDGVRLWVNGVQLVNNWTNHSATENSGSIALTAGQRYDIVMEYYDNTLDATAKLLWSSPSQSKQIIPQSSLYPN